MAEHTPGPWEQYAKLTASENHKGFEVQDVASQHWVATVGPRDMDGNEGEANARLIAAAPDLLEALLQLRHDHHVMRHHKERKQEFCFEEFCPVANAAIRKATEGSSAAVSEVRDG